MRFSSFINMYRMLSFRSCHKYNRLLVTAIQPDSFLIGSVHLVLQIIMCCRIIQKGIHPAFSSFKAKTKMHRRTDELQVLVCSDPVSSRAAVRWLVSYQWKLYFLPC